jgi:hypothetical protein
VDIDIDLSVSSGSADLYVTTFNSTSEDFVQRLPKREDEALWLSEGITSINSGSDDKDIIVMQNDRNYCTDCYYVIGVVTHEAQASYQLQVRTLLAEKSGDSTHLLRLGQVKIVKLNALKNMTRFQFMLDSKEPAVIVPTLITGRVKLFVSFSDQANAFAAEEGGSNAIRIIGERIQTERNYYVFVEALTASAELSLTVQQQHSIITLNDGQP